MNSGDALGHDLAAAATAAWHQVAPCGSTVADAECLQKAKKGKPPVWNLKLVSGAVPSVVAKKVKLAEARQEDCIYRDLLPLSRLPAPAYFGMVPTLDGAAAWIFVEYVEGGDYSSDNAQHRRLAAEWLGDLHSALTRAAVPTPLTKLGSVHYRKQLDTVIRTLSETRENPALGSAGRAEVDRLQQILVEFAAGWRSISRVAGSFEQTLVHGSFGPRNMRVSGARSRPTLMVFDWGAAGWGSPARDVAKLAADRLGGDPGIYCKRRGLDVKAAPSLVALGNLFRAIEHLHWSVPMLAYECVDEPLAKVSKHALVLQMVADSGVLDLAP
jgi:aminoglycoside phosphotransferase (APT) family kinase protein